MTILFYCLAALTAMFSVATVFSKNILRSTVCLMGVLSLSAGLYLFVGAEFLAGVQVLVYVGGIVVLLVFAVMLTRSGELLDDHPSTFRKILGFLASFSFFIISLFALSNASLPSPSLPSDYANTKEIGVKLLDSGASGYVLPFEVISLLLLAALIGGIVISRNDPTNREEKS